MKKMLITGLIGTTLVGGLVFTGSDTIRDAIAYIQTATVNANQYESNEQKLVERLTEVKNAKSELEKKVNELTNSAKEKEEEIITLKSEIEEKAIEISKLEEEVEELKKLLAENTDLYTEVKRLEGELDKANNLTDDLKVKLETSNVGDPMTDEEMDNLFADTIEINDGINKFTIDSVDFEINYNQRYDYIAYKNCTGNSIDLYVEYYSYYMTNDDNNAELIKDTISVYPDYVTYHLDGKAIKIKLNNETYIFEYK